uniref:Outer membrane protein TolC n=1 Tax=Candidatus Kentrum sp. FW TaxID=2126338 RepID=A0A450TZ05_9GAMM|nr:MAG: Outer membrane protein TolC [Candidatus Kentron sp. FW]
MQRYMLLNPVAILLTAALSIPLCAHARNITLAESLVSTLQNQSGVQLAQAAVWEDKGVLQQAQGAFDWTPKLGAAVGITRELGMDITGSKFGLNKTEAVKTSVGVTKLFRSGIAISPEISLTRIDRNAFYDPLSHSKISILVTIPLLKGAGKISASADEQAAEKNLRATGKQQVHRISQLLFETVSAYWRVRGSWQSLEVTESSLERSRQVKATVEALVRGGQLTPGDHQRTLAEINLHEISIDKQRQSFHGARQILLYAMGSVENDNLRAVTPLPNPSDPRFETGPKTEKLVALALARRQDLVAAAYLLEANEILAARFRHDLKPQLDLLLGLGYQGIETNTHAPLGSARTLHRDLAGPDYSAILSLDLPLGNNVAKGQLREQNAKVTMARARIRDLESAIRTRVRTVAERLLSSRRRHRTAERTVALYEQVYRDTWDRMVRGEAEMNELINVDDKLTDTLLRRTDAATDFAIALAELRFVTGTAAARVHGAETDSSVAFTPDNFMNLPELFDRLPKVVTEE